MESDVKCNASRAAKGNESILRWYMTSYAFCRILLLLLLFVSVIFLRSVHQGNMCGVCGEAGLWTWGGYICEVWKMRRVAGLLQKFSQSITLVGGLLQPVSNVQAH